MFPTLDNWRECIDDDCVVIFDADSLAYNAASAAQEDYVRVFLNNKFEVTKKGKELFKSKKEFYGLGKKISGFLHDKNEERLKSGLSELSKENFTFETYTKDLGLPIAKSLLKSKIQSVLNHLGCSNYILLLGAKNGNNFRLDLPLPRRYKTKRGYRDKPIHLESLKEWIADQQNSILVYDKEVDDSIQVYAHSSYLHFKKTGKIKFIPVSIDKDQRGTTSGIILFNNQRNSDGSGFTYPDIQIIEGLGGCVDNGDPKFWGFKSVAYQMLCGDDTDDYSPRKGICKARYGDKSAYKDLIKLESIKECVEFVDSKYYEWFPEGVSFDDWRGCKINLTTDEWKDIIFKCVWMTHKEDEKLTWSDIKKEYQ